MNQTYKANMLVITLFIMIITSLFWLLIIQNVTGMLTYTGDVIWYYKAYYLAHAWVELQLTKIDNHDVGFWETIPKWSQTNAANWKSGWSNDPYFNVDTDWYWSYISECNVNPIKLAAWEWIIVPMFLDRETHPSAWNLRVTSEAPILWSSTPNINRTIWGFANRIELSLTSTNSNPDNFVVSIIDENILNWWFSFNTMSNISKKLENTWWGFRSLNELKPAVWPVPIVWFTDPALFAWAWSTRKDLDNPFLIIASKYDWWEVCVKGLTSIPYPLVNIKSTGHYGWKKVILDVNKSVELPDYLIYTTLN